MSWSDKPTKPQINALYRMAYWSLTRAELQDALKWLEDNGTKKQASDELGRVRGLYIEHNLNRDRFFNSPVWEEYFNSKT